MTPVKCSSLVRTDLLMVAMMESKRSFPSLSEITEGVRVLCPIRNRYTVEMPLLTSIGTSPWVNVLSQGGEIVAPSLKNVGLEFVFDLKRSGVRLVTSRVVPLTWRGMPFYAPIVAYLFAWAGFGLAIMSVVPGFLIALGFLALTAIVHKLFVTY